MVGYNILPIGFSSYEKSTIETFFRLAGRRAPHWGLTTRSSEARVVLFNAASQQDIESFRSLVASWQKVILVGGSDFGTGWPVLPRPIKLTAILGMLDALVDVEVVTQQATQQAPAGSTAPAAPATPGLPAAMAKKPNMTDVFANITSKVEPAVAPVLTPKPAAMPVAVGLPVGEARGLATGISNVEQLTSGKIVTRSTPSTVIGRVLIVDDSDIALKYMQNRLRHFGYECELARSGEEALTMVGTNNYQFVFLDVMMAGLDGYQTCKAIKNNKARRGPAPVVVMLTSKGGAIDKIRGSMAGCDAYLTKPLNDNRLGAVLAKFDETTIRQRWEAANPQQPLVDTYSPRSR
jgi:two-component system, cell cycle response regulator